MMRAMILICVLAPSSALVSKFQQSAELEGCPVTCMCSKDQFSFLWNKAAPQKNKQREIDEAKALLSASLKEMDDADANRFKAEPQAGLFGTLAAPVRKKTVEQLQMEIDRRTKKVQTLEEELASVQQETGSELAGELCCTNHANAERDCAGEDRAGVREYNEAQEQAAIDAKAAEERREAAEEAVKKIGFFPNRLTFDKTEEERAAIEAQEGEASRLAFEKLQKQTEKEQAQYEENKKKYEWFAANKEAMAAEKAAIAVQKQADREAAKKRLADKLDSEDAYGVR